MKKDRFLLAILAGIFLLVIAAIVVFFTRTDRAVYVDGNEPADVVHNYVVAVHLEDWEKAYGYLAALKNKPTFAEFTTTFAENGMTTRSIGVELGKENIVGNNATVEINILVSNFTPFSSGYRSSDLAILEYQKGEWKISKMPYDLWGWNWYQK